MASSGRRGRKIQWARTHFLVSGGAGRCATFLVDRARRKSALRHGGGQQRVEFDELRLAAPDNDSQILAVNDALDKFARENKLGADLVNLRYFGGLTLAEAAQALGVSERTADNYWAYAKVWLVREIRTPSTLGFSRFPPHSGSAAIFRSSLLASPG